MSNTTVLVNGFSATCNTTIEDWNLCTPETCCLEQAQIFYIPSLAGNALYAAIFGLLLIAQLFFGIRYRTWSFVTWMSFGLVGELVGYIGRIMLHNNVFDFNAFLIYLIPLTIAPAFITASIYLCLARIIHIVDPKLEATRLKPMTYTKIFVTSDFISLVLQGAGGGLAATADDQAGSDTGINVMIAGLAFQVISIVVFIALCSDFAFRLWKQHSKPKMSSSLSLRTKAGNNDAYDEDTSTNARIRATRLFRLFILALALATLFILIRSSYRLAELQGGFNGKLANDEVTFMILEGPMIILAAVCLTGAHPGLAMRGLWSMKDLQRVSRGAASGTEKVQDLSSGNNSAEGLTMGHMRGEA